MGNGKIHTGVDAVIKLVRERGRVTLSEAARILNMDKRSLEEIVRILDEQGIVKIQYTFVGEKVLTKGEKIDSLEIQEKPSLKPKEVEGRADEILSLIKRRIATKRLEAPKRKITPPKEKEGEKRRGEKAEKLEIFRKRLSELKKEGYSVSSLESVMDKDLRAIEKEFEAYEKKLAKLKELRDEFYSLEKIEDLKDVYSSVESKLKDPEKINEIEAEINKVKKILEERKRLEEEVKKKEESIKEKEKEVERKESKISILLEIVKHDEQLTKIHKQMEDDKITKYIDSGWMPPLDFVKTLRKKTRDKK